MKFTRKELAQRQVWIIGDTHETSGEETDAQQSLPKESFACLLRGELNLEAPGTRIHGRGGVVFLTVSLLHHRCAGLAERH